MKLPQLFRWAYNRLTRNVDDPFPRTPQVPLRRAGMHVTHDTALTHSAVYAAVRVIAETISTLPWRTLRMDGGKRLRVDRHPAEWLLHRSPNKDVTPFIWRSTILAHALLWGNGYAEIERDNVGRPYALWLISPDRVTPKRDRYTGEIYYEVYSHQGGVLELPAADMFHLRGLGHDELLGYSVISLASKSIGLGLAAEDFGSSLFANGAMPYSVLRHPSHLSSEAQARLKETIKNQYEGSKNAFRTMVLEEGMELSSVGIPPQDAQFLETRKFQVTDVARWFRVPPHKIADLDRATYSNIEHQGREFVADTIVPWTTRLEQEANKKLLTGRERAANLYTKIDVNGLMRGDTQARSEYYTKMFQMGVFSINDIRELEDMDPIGPDGDKRLVQTNLTTLDKIGIEETDELPGTEQVSEPS